MLFGTSPLLFLAIYHCIFIADLCTGTIKYSKDMFQISSIFPVEMELKKAPELASSKSLPNTIPQSTVTPSSPCLVGVLNWGAAFGYVPFKIKQNRVSGRYQIESINIIRKIFCAIVHIFAVCLYIHFHTRVTVLTKPTELSSNFIQTFDFVTSIGSLALIILSSYTFWRCRSQLLAILEQSRVDSSSSSLLRLKSIATAVFFGAYFTANYIYRNYYSESTYYMDVFNGTTTQDTLISVLDAIYDIFVHHCLAISFYTYVTIAMVGLTMRGVRIHFAERMNKSSATLDINGGFEYYMALKELTANITNTFGNQILIYYIISVAYFAKIPEMSVWQRAVETIGMTSYFAMGAILWLMSAEFHMSVRDVVQNWATQMQDLDDLMVDTRIRLLSVVNDNLLDPIGVSCKFFTITYGFLGSMLGLIVTYAIIVFQMQTKPQPTALASYIPESIMETIFSTVTSPVDDSDGVQMNTAS